MNKIIKILIFAILIIILLGVVLFLAKKINLEKSGLEKSGLNDCYQKLNCEAIKLFSQCNSTCNQNFCSNHKCSDLYDPCADECKEKYGSFYYFDEMNCDCCVNFTNISSYNSCLHRVELLD